MAKTELATNKKQEAYKALAESFLTRSFPKKTFDPMAKANFLRICMINNLDPFKGEIYPLPFTDKTGKTTISAVIDYHIFLNRAEESGKLTGWKIEHKKENGKIVSSKITIYRNDRTQPFVYEAEIEDVKNSNTPLWTSKPEMMMRKQMIRIGFSLAFPESCSKLNPEDDDVDPEMAEIIDGEKVVIAESEAKPDVVGETEREEFNDTRTEEDMNDDPDMPPPTFLGDDDGTPVSEDQKRIIEELLIDVPEVLLGTIVTYKQAEEGIFKIKTAIFNKIVKSKKPCTDDYLSMVFGNSDDVRIQGMYNSLKKYFKEREK